MLYSWDIVCRGQWSTWVHCVSYSQRRVEVGRALWRSSQRAGQLQQIAQGCVNLEFEPLCGWRHHSLLWVYYQVTTKMHGSRFQGAKSTWISWIFIAAPLHTSFTACFQVAISSLAAGSPSQPIWADLSPHCCHYTGHVYSWFPQKEVDGSRWMPGSTSQLFWCNFQPLQVTELLYHQRMIN